MESWKDRAEWTLQAQKKTNNKMMPMKVLGDEERTRTRKDSLRSLHVGRPQINPMGDSSYSYSRTLLAFSPLAYLANELLFSGFGVPSLRELCTTNLSAFILVLQGLPAVVLCVHVSALVSRQTAASGKARTASPAVASGVSPSSPDGEEVERQQAADAAAADANTVKTCNRAKAEEPELVQENNTTSRAGAPSELPRKGSVRDTVRYYEFLDFIASPDKKTLPSTPAGEPGAVSSRTNRSDSGAETDVSSETSSAIPVPRVVHKQQPPTRASSMNNIRKNFVGLKRHMGKSERRKIF